jgi:hypothetical protein
VTEEGRSERAAAAGDFDGSAEPNAKIRRQAEIKALLEEMTGRTLKMGLAGVLLGEPNIPDFESAGPRESYAKMSKKAEALRRSIGALSSAWDSLRALLATDPSLEIIGRSGFQVGRDEDLFTNIVKLYGPYRAAIVSIVWLASSLDNELRTIEQELRAFYPHRGRGRRKHARAYLVAERLAHYYLEATKERPTYGTDGNIPSTPYTRCLEGLFKILGINAGLRGPAEAACRTMKDEQDLLAKVAGRRNNR